MMEKDLSINLEIHGEFLEGVKSRTGVRKKLKDVFKLELIKDEPNN